MSLKAKLEAVIYAAEEPVTLAQLSALFAAEALEWKAGREAARAAETGEESAPGTEALPLGWEPEAQAKPEPEAQPEAEAAEGAEEAAGAGEETAPAAGEQPKTAEAEARKQARLKEREVRGILR